MMIVMTPKMNVEFARFETRVSVPELTQTNGQRLGDRGLEGEGD